MAPVAPVGLRLESVVAATRVRPQLGALPELRRRLLPDAALALPPALVARRCRRHARHARARPPARAPRARAAARGVAREPLLIEWLRQQERVLLAAQPQQPHRQPGGVAAAAVPAAAPGAVGARRVARRAGRGLGGRALRVGPHADAVDAAAAARRRGGARAGHEGGVPGVPQAAGAEARLAGAAAPGTARRDRLLTPPRPLRPSRILFSHRLLFFSTYPYLCLALNLELRLPCIAACADPT